MNKPSTPVAAATILMLRNTPSGLQVFMVVRHHQIDFVGGALVFPGGKINAGDGKVRARCTGVDQIDDSQLAIQVGAIREAFEECGILLARPAGSDALIDGKRLKSLDHYRVPLAKDEVELAEFLDKEDLILACELLQPFSHWVTPEMMPKRFDTYFYLAAAPEDHLAIHDGHESVDSVWMSPVEALDGSQSGKYTIIFPTRLNIDMLSSSKTVEAAIKDAMGRKIVTVTPWTEKRDDATYLCIPKEAGYRNSEEKLEMKSGPQ